MAKTKSIKKTRALLNKVYREAAVYNAMTKTSDADHGACYVDLDQDPFREELVDAGLTDVLEYMRDIDKNMAS